MRSRASVASHPIHPMLLVFPLALWIASFTFDVIGTLSQNDLLWAGGFYLIIGGCTTQFQRAP